MQDESPAIFPSPQTTVPTISTLFDDKSSKLINAGIAPDETTTFVCCDVPDAV